MTTLTRGCAPLLILFATTHAALATFPVEELDCGVFDYADPNFSPYENAFASELSFSWPAPNGVTDTISTGLWGSQFGADDLAAIAPPPGDPNGVEVPANGTAFTDLFPATPAPQAKDGWVSTSTYIMGDYVEGLSEFSIRQRKVAEVEQTDPSSGFVDLAGKTKSYSVFTVDGGEDDQVEAALSIDLSGLVGATGNGGGSEGVEAFMLNVTDPNNIWVVANFSGFYGEDSLGGFYDFVAGNGDPANDMSLNDDFSYVDNGQGFNQADLAYDLSVILEAGEMYGLGVNSDVSAFVTGGVGGVSMQLDFTYEVGVALQNEGDRILVPGFDAVPEPSAALLLLAGGAACGFRRR